MIEAASNGSERSETPSTFLSLLPALLTLVLGIAAVYGFVVERQTTSILFLTVQSIVLLAVLALAALMALCVAMTPSVNSKRQGSPSALIAVVLAVLCAGGILAFTHFADRVHEDIVERRQTVKDHYQGVKTAMARLGRGGSWTAWNATSGPGHLLARLVHFASWGIACLVQLIAPVVLCAASGSSWKRYCSQGMHSRWLVSLLAAGLFVGLFLLGFYVSRAQPELSMEMWTPSAVWDFFRTLKANQYFGLAGGASLILTVICASGGRVNSPNADSGAEHDG